MFKSHKKYAQNVLEFCDKPFSPASLYSGFLEIPLARFDEVEAKILALRNFLSEVSNEKNLKRSKDLNKIMVFQFDLNLFPVFEKNVIKK